ncbi:hypothetical protein ACFTAO_34510 [Paenibacillus rhizoplanae]
MMMKGSPEPIGNQFQPYNVGTSLQEVNLGMEEVAASDSLEEAK